MRTFEGVRVIGFTQAIAGPFATYQLALMGADVIKIEQREGATRGGRCTRWTRDCAPTVTRRSNCPLIRENGP